MWPNVGFDWMGRMHHLRVIMLQSWRVLQICHTPSKIGLRWRITYITFSSGTEFGRCFSFINIQPPSSSTHLILVSTAGWAAFRIWSRLTWADWVSTKTFMMVLNSSILIIFPKTVILAFFNCHTCVVVYIIWTFQHSVTTISVTTSNN